MEVFSQKIGGMRSGSHGTDYTARRDKYSNWGRLDDPIRGFWTSCRRNNPVLDDLLGGGGSRRKEEK